MAKRKAAAPDDVAALKARIKELEAGQGRRAAPEQAEDFQEFPKAKYKKNAAKPLGYEVRRVNSAEEEAALPKGWLDAPPSDE